MKTRNTICSKPSISRKVELVLILILCSATLFGQKVEILGDTKVDGNLEIMDTIKFTDGTALASACLQLLSDADNDTKIEVEKNPDEDLIRFISAGQEIAVMDRKRLLLLHDGSIFIGKSTGSKDDGGNSNIFIGNEAGETNSNGSRNVYIGHASGRDNSSGFHNTYIGNSAGNGVEGGQNTIIGFAAGEKSRGDYNTILGANAGNSLVGSKNVLIGNGVGSGDRLESTLIIDNQRRSKPFIRGNFASDSLIMNANTRIKKDLLVEESIRLSELEASTTPSSGFMLGFDNEDKFGISASRFDLIQNVTIDWLNIGPIDQNGEIEKTLNITQEGRVGIGTLSPVYAFEVQSSNAISHVMRIENTAPGVEGDGLEIRLNRSNNGAGNNFITFTGLDGVAGRIEGFNALEDVEYENFPDIDFSLYFDVLNIENFSFSPGELPTISGGQLPTLSGGQFPTLNPGVLPSLNRGSFPNLIPGQLPSLSGGSFGTFSLNATFDGDAFVSNVLCGPFCADPQEVYTFQPLISGASFPSLSPGQLPSLSGGQLPTLNVGQLPTLSGGQFPSLNPGSLPTISGGQLPSIDFDFIIDPSPISVAFDNFTDIICWALRNGERSLISANPWDLAMQKSDAYLRTIANCKNGGVTYGSRGADYAEYLKRRDFNEKIEAGQVVGVIGGKISKNTENAEQLLVISMMPVILGNIPEDTSKIDQYEKVAFLGQAPVWVVGHVQSGDFIIPSGNNDGYGIAKSPNELKMEDVPKVIGRSWSNGYDNINLVSMVVGIKTNEMSMLMGKMSKEVDEIDQRLAKLEAYLESTELSKNESE